VSNEAGVNPVEAMSESQEAEALAEAMVFLGTDFEAAVEGLAAAVSEHVAGALDDYGLDTMTHIRRVAENGINLAQNVQGADLAIADTDHENAEEYQEGLEALDLQINF
jgi:division protein CdvB (Snf7/Vps24/ESCRT-III family)